MVISLIYNSKSYLPEVTAYKEFFNKTSVRCLDNTKNNFSDSSVTWKLMGFDFMKSNQKLIHDYASLSTGNFPRIKNFLKRKLNTKPDLRLFLNEEVRDGFGFNDNVPYILRDMGIHKSFFINYENYKKYDFVYMGSISKARGTDKLINFFTSELYNNSLLVIGEIPKFLLKKTQNSKNIFTTGRIPLDKVSFFASQATYGINFIPDKYPFNIQTSTKLQEYCAMGLKIITTDYKWVNQFEIKYSASFFKLNKDLSNFNINELEKFNFITPELNELEWDKLFDDIDLLRKINNLLTKKK